MVVRYNLKVGCVILTVKHLVVPILVVTFHMKKYLAVFLAFFLFNVTTVVAKEILKKETFIKKDVTYITRTSRPVSGVVAKYYHLNRLLASRVNYKNGLKDGLEESFYRNGRLHYRVNYKNGQQDGLSEYFHTNGQLSSRVSYKNGQVEGSGEYFDKSGEKTKGPHS